MQNSLHTGDLSQSFPVSKHMSPKSHQIFMQHALSQNDLEDTQFLIHFRTKSAENFFFEELNASSWSNFGGGLKKKH